ncbi:MAG TPA: ankyrin repeat domain-containing protein [Pyrinomonadaceae bacterium]
MKRIIPLILLLLIGSSQAFAQRQIDEDFLNAVQQKDLTKINQLLSQGANINARSRINGYFALQYAINWPSLDLVKLLIDKGANVNIADDGGNTALTEAAGRHGPEYTAIVKYLIARGADIHADHDAAIFAAANQAEPEIVKLLLSKGAPVNARNKERDNNTVLMEAAGGSSVETVQLLLTAGADVKAVNDNGESALMKAVALDHRYQPQQRLPMIELLLSKGADINGTDKNGKSPLLYSVTQYMSEAGGVISHPEVVKLLLERGANVAAVDQNGDNALIITTGVYQGPIEIVRLLLQKGINHNAQNKRGTTALMVAASKGKAEVVNLLLEKGADLNLKDSDGATALDYAVESGQTELAKSLFARSAKSKNDYKTEADLLRAATNAALLEFASRNNLEEVKKQLANGAYINTRSRAGATPLMLSVEYSYGRQDVTNFLLDQGADLNLVDLTGNSALMKAAHTNNAEAATALTNRKAASDLRNKEGQTALHIAAAGLHTKIVAAILAHKSEGLDVNAPDGSGRTPLILAADNEDSVPDDVMDLLLNSGARIDAQDPQGNTALMISVRQGSMSGVEFLLAHRANANLKNSAGETALKLARKIHENDRIINAKLIEDKVVAMLVQAGAKE